jgi:hypothetical protein
MTDRDAPIDDETTMTEITIQPDGRVYIFGTSRSMLDILEELNPKCGWLQELIGQVRSNETAAAGGCETQEGVTDARRE